MFCPRCGKPDQLPEHFCRHCGTLVPDIDAPAKKKTAPEDHVKAASYLSLLTAIVALALAITLYSTLAFRQDTPFVIYLVAGFLIAITAWQIQTFIRSLLLKRQLADLAARRRPTATLIAEPRQPEGLFGETPPFEGASVTEMTTKDLAMTERRSTKS